MTKREKLATLFGLLIEPRRPSELSAETRALIGLPFALPGGGYSIEDVKIGTVEALADLLSELLGALVEVPQYRFRHTPGALERGHRGGTVIDLSDVISLVQTEHSRITGHRSAWDQLKHRLDVDGFTFGRDGEDDCATCGELRSLERRS